MASSFGNRVLTTTQDKMLAKVVDTVLNGNVLATRMLSKAKKWSGEQMKFPIKYQKGVSGQAFTGYDTLSTSASDTRVKLVFDPKFYSAPVSLPLTELSVNDTDSKVIDLMAVELESRAQDIADDIGTYFYGTDTDNSKEFMGLADIVDDGSVKTTYGELLRATYTGLNSTLTASGGTLTLDKMATLYNAITSGSQKPTLGLTTEAIFSLYEKLLTPQERMTKDVSVVKSGLTGGTGYTALFYKGMPIIADEKCTSGVLFFLNEDYLDWYALPMAETTPINFSSKDIEGNDYSSVKGLGFSWSNWIKPSNQAALVGQIYLGGQLLSKNPKRHGKLTGITTV